MNAAALLGLSAKERQFKSFASAKRIQLSVAIEPAQNHDAAVIFGGDRTVQRHLPRLDQQKIPTLVVSTGSGSDFAMALGIRNVDTALRAWKQFCSDGTNARNIDLGDSSGRPRKAFLLRCWGWH